MGSGIVTRFALIGSLIALYALIFVLRPIWFGIWQNLLLLDLSYLGYLFLAISILGVIGIVMSNARKHPSRRNFFLVTAIFAMIIALDLIFSVWYATIWFASVLIPQKKQEMFEEISESANMAVMLPEAIPA